MLQLVIIIMIILSLFLMLVVLIQNPKGAGTFSGGGIGSTASDIFGVQRTGDILEKTTWVTIAAIIILAILSSALLPKVSDTGKVKTISEQENIDDKAKKPNLTPTGVKPNAAPSSTTPTPTGK